MERKVIRRERRTLLIFWAVVVLLIVSAFAAEGLLRDEVCISGQIVDAYSTTTYPVQCS